MFDKLNELNQIKKEYFSKLQVESEEALKATVKSFLDAHRIVQELHWTQYTPYFNDGDACYFAVHEPTVRFHGDPEDKYHEYSYYWTLKKDLDPIKAAVGNDLQLLYNSLQQLEDMLQLVFGDHVHIMATGEEITVEEIEHD